jgi:alpha-tubulin suppressor-like RCC1 family protein
MRRRAAVAAVVSAPLMPAADARADASHSDLASYYDRHMANAGGLAWGWFGSRSPRRMRERIVQVGVSQDAFFALDENGALVSWTEAPERARVLMRGVARFAAGQSGWFAIDAAGVLWHAAGGRPPQRVADDVADACIGDGADYYVTRDGTLCVKGLAQRGQYGDGKLAATADFVATARDVVAVRAHTGHAIHLRRDGVVMGTGGNRFGPLSTHGLGDKADRWGAIFDGATAIATGSRHSAAIRADASLWVWGAGFDLKPARLMEGVAAVACGDTATIARGVDGRLWQWDGGGSPRAVRLA